MEIDTPYGPIDFEWGQEGPARPADVKNRPEDPAEFAAWKDQARKWRAWSWAKDNWRDTQLALGASLEDLGIRPVKEEGLAAYNRFRKWDQEGLSSPNFIYDWAGRRKKNVATSDSDPNSPTGNQSWVPISDEEWRQYNAQKAFGNNEGDYIRRLQADQRGWITRALDQGQLMRDPRNGLIWDGENTYFDDYGAVIDPNTRKRVGGVYGDAVYGDTQPYRPAAGQENGRVSIPRDFVPNPNPTPNPTPNPSPTTTESTPYNYYAKGYSRPYLKTENPLNYRGWYGSLNGAVGQPSAMTSAVTNPTTNPTKPAGVISQPNGLARSEFGVLPGEDYPGSEAWKAGRIGGTKPPEVGGGRVTKPPVVIGPGPTRLPPDDIFGTKQPPVKQGDTSQVPPVTPPGGHFTRPPISDDPGTINDLGINNIGPEVKPFSYKYNQQLFNQAIGQPRLFGSRQQVV